MAGSTGPAVRLWARSDLRRRWLSLVVLGVLAGVTAGLAAAAFAGAQRTATALERLRERTAAPDALVFASQVGLAHPDWSALRAAPEVQDLAVWDLVQGTVDGQPDATLFAANDAAFGDRVSRPYMVQGRMWDPSAPDEVVVSPVLAGDYPVGSTITVQPYGVDQNEDESEPTGPEIRLHVVGVGNLTNRFLFAEDQAFISPGFVATYRDRVRLAENADVVLRDGARDVPALQRTVNGVIAPGTPLLDVHNAARRVDTTLAVEHGALLLLAAAIAVAGGLLVLQTLARSVSSLGEDGPAMRAMGLGHRSLQAAGATTHVLAAVVAAVTTAVAAVAMSPMLPVGLARKVDPAHGVQVDAVVVVVAALGAGALVLVATTYFVGAQLRTRRSQRSPSRWLAAIRRSAPVAVGLGATLALDPGADRRRVAVRPALLGAVVGVLGVTAALTVQHGVDEALAHPERAGVTWSAVVAPPTEAYGSRSLVPDAVDQIAAALPSSSTLAEADRIVLPANGVGVPTFTLRDIGAPGEPLGLTTVSGHPPGVGEAAIGPKTAADLGVHTGDTITLGEAGRTVTIVGTALFPSDVHAEFDEGLWVDADEFDAVVPPVSAENLFQGPERVVLARFPLGTDADAAISAAREQLGPAGGYVAPGDLPAELTNLHNVRVLPIALAVFLALLAFAALGYLLVSTSRRRLRDFGVLRTLGLDRRSTRRIVHVQATTIAIVGLVLGVVLGVAAGRLAWHWIAEQVPLQVVSPTAVVAVVLIVPATLVMVNALAIVPARRAARGSPAAALRAE